jgi:hypothetical protein
MRNSALSAYNLDDEPFFAAHTQRVGSGLEGNWQMRSTIISIGLAVGLLTLGACSTSVEPRTQTLAELRQQCRGEIVPTGRQTGDARHDYDCRSRHASGADRANNTAAGAIRSAANDRSSGRAF